MVRHLVGSSQGVVTLLVFFGPDKHNCALSNICLVTDNNEVLSSVLSLHKAESNHKVDPRPNDMAMCFSALHVSGFAYVVLSHPLLSKSESLNRAHTL